MGRAPCCDKANVKKGPWSPEEDAKLKEYMEKQGTGGNWIALPQKAGLRRCGKSCRLRWLNYLRPNIKHGEFSDEEDRVICSLYASIGSRWSIIAAQLPGRTDNDIKNYWNTKLKKKLMGLVSSSQKTRPHHHPPSISSLPLIKCSNNNYYPPPTFHHDFQAAAFSIPPSQQHSAGGFLNLPTTCSSTAYVVPIQNQNHHMVITDRVLNFGGADQAAAAAASCSSSDGSCTNNNHTQVVEFDHHYTENLGGLQSFVYNNNGVYDAADVKPSVVESGLCYGGNNNNDNNPLDYSCLEEIKQLITTNNMCNSLNNFFVDENKTEEKVVLYY